MLPQSVIYFTSFFASIGTLTYAYQTFKGQVKPNRVSWLMWSVSVFLGHMIALFNGVSILDTIPLFVSWATCFTVFLVSFFNKHAYWKLSNFDYICGFLSVCALLVWLVADSPLIALCIAILSDLFAGLPTLYKTFKYPESESLSSYLPGFVNTLVGILILTNISFYNSAFLIWLTISNLIKVLVILKHRYMV